MDAAGILGICVLFFVIATVYSAAGFGGGSSYLAILSLTLDDFLTVRLLALLCNLVVVSSSLTQFSSRGLLRADRLIILVATSVPAAFLAAQWKLQSATFFTLLGLSLLAASLAMLLTHQADETAAYRRSSRVDAVLGGAVGSLSGLVGIGGGIFLSPLLHLLNWDTAKRIAATATAFIAVNSLAGLAGLMVSDQIRLSDTRWLWTLVAVLVGGQLGVRFCLSNVTIRRIRQLTAIIVLMAGVRILLNQIS